MYVSWYYSPYTSVLLRIEAWGEIVKYPKVRNYAMYGYCMYLSVCFYSLVGGPAQSIVPSNQKPDNYVMYLYSQYSLCK